MQSVLNPLAGVYQTQLEASRRFADAIFSGTERFDRVVIGATHRIFTEQLNLAQALANMRDPRSIGTTMQSGFLSRNPDDAMNYQREIMRIFADVQNEISRSMQDCMEQMRNQAGTAVPAVAPAGASSNDRPAGNDFNPVTNMFSVWESAFKEVAAMAKNNMISARSNMEDAVSKAAQATTRYATTAPGNFGAGPGTIEDATNVAAQAAGKVVAEAEANGEDRKGHGVPGGGKKHRQH